MACWTIRPPSGLGKAGSLGWPNAAFNCAATGSFGKRIMTNRKVRKAETKRFSVLGERAGVPRPAVGVWFLLMTFKEWNRN